MSPGAPWAKPGEASGHDRVSRCLHKLYSFNFPCNRFRVRKNKNHADVLRNSSDMIRSLTPVAKGDYPFRHRGKRCRSPTTALLRSAIDAKEHAMLKWNSVEISDNTYGYTWVVGRNKKSRQLQAQKLTLQERIPKDRIFSDVCSEHFGTRDGFRNLVRVTESGAQLAIIWPNDPDFHHDILLELNLMQMVLSWFDIEVVHVGASNKRPRGQPRKLTWAQALKSRQLKEQGWSLRQIAAKFGCSPGAVRSAVAWVEDTLSSRQ